jgi:carbamoyl-phosphate synthase large subunit
MPFPSEGWNGFKNRIDEIQNDGGLDIIIPCLDSELPLFIKKQDELKKQGISVLLPSEKSFDLRNKEKLENLGKDIGVKNPQTIPVRNFKELHKAIESIGFPVMVKGPYYKAKKVNSMDEANKTFTSLAAEWGFPVLVQKIVHGEEINLVGLGDGEGNLLGHVSVKKTTITELGKIWSCVTIHHHELEKLAERFVKFTKWRGPFELECISKKEELYMIEINPRFPAWCYFATAVGVNLPLALVSLIMGTNNFQPDYEAGKFFMRFTEELVCDLNQFRNLVTKGVSYAK